MVSPHAVDTASGVDLDDEAHGAVAHARTPDDGIAERHRDERAANRN